MQLRTRLHFFIYLDFLIPKKDVRPASVGGSGCRIRAVPRSVPACCTVKEGPSLLALPDVTTLPGGLPRSVGALHSHALVTLLVVLSLRFALMYG